MADHPQKVAARPLSPHLSIYRWPITMATSITHRMTGIGLTGGVLLIVWWLVAAASGPEAYDFFLMVMGNPLAQIVVFGFTWSLVYHLLNGVRHLAWDFGFGFEVKTANRTGIQVFVVSILLTIGVFVLAYAGYGGYYK